MISLWDTLRRAEKIDKENSCNLLRISEYTGYKVYVLFCGPYLLLIFTDRTTDERSIKRESTLV